MGCGMWPIGYSLCLGLFPCHPWLPSPSRAVCSHFQAAFSFTISCNHHKKLKKYPICIFILQAIHTLQQSITCLLSLITMQTNRIQKKRYKLTVSPFLCYHETILSFFLLLCLEADQLPLFLSRDHCSSADPPTLIHEDEFSNWQNCHFF